VRSGPGLDQSFSTGQIPTTRPLTGSCRTTDRRRNPVNNFGSYTVPPGRSAAAGSVAAGLASIGSQVVGTLSAYEADRTGRVEQVFYSGRRGRWWLRTRGGYPLEGPCPRWPASRAGCQQRAGWARSAGQALLDQRARRRLAGPAGPAPGVAPRRTPVGGQSRLRRAAATGPVGHCGGVGPGRAAHHRVSGVVSANPPKHDAWRPYGDVRFVLIRNTGRLKPSRGLILDWKREGRRWKPWWSGMTTRPSSRSSRWTGCRSTI